MALAPIAPWVVPPDYTGTIERAVSLGTQLRGQDIQAQESSDRLRFAYDQLASEEQQRAKEQQAKLQLAQAAMALKGQQMNLLDQYRQAQIGNAQQRMSDLFDYRQQELAQREQLADAANKLRQRNIHFGAQGEVLKVNEDGTVSQIRPPDTKTGKEATVTIPLDPSNPFGPKIAGPLSDPEIKRRYDALNAPKPAAPTTGGFNLLKPSTWMKPTVPGPTTTTTAPAPYKEGTFLRDKTTGRRFKVVNGNPVEVDDSGNPTGQ